MQWFFRGAIVGRLAALPRLLLALEKFLKAVDRGFFHHRNNLLSALLIVRIISEQASPVRHPASTRSSSAKRRVIRPTAAFSLRRHAAQDVMRLRSPGLAMATQPTTPWIERRRLP